jgi:hypothetical protein
VGHSFSMFGRAFDNSGFLGRLDVGKRSTDPSAEAYSRTFPGGLGLDVPWSELGSPLGSPLHYSCLKRPSTDSNDRLGFYWHRRVSGNLICPISRAGELRRPEVAALVPYGEARYPTRFTWTFQIF